MKAHLLYETRSIRLRARGRAAPHEHADLTQDLELDDAAGSDGGGRQVIFEVAKRALLVSLRDPEAIRLPPAGTDRLPRPARGGARTLWPRRRAALEAKRAVWG